MRKVKIVGRVVLIVFIFLLIFGLSRSRAQLFTFGNSLEGKSAPEFILSTLTKKDIKLSELRNGQPAMIFFWATWCPSCRETLGALNVRAPEIEKQGLKIILVDVGESRADV
ncbi:MAG: redoxin domain-containing protein, partial [Candidatus Omnitrophica bacterium]|nr:redoxin domain-containing protein [Candidatus Omnitrophota bacterium]